MPEQTTGAEQAPQLSPQERILAMLNAEEAAVGGEEAQRRRERPEGTQDPSQVADDDPEADLGSEDDDLDFDDENPDEDTLEEGEEFEEGLEDDDSGEPDLHTVKVDGEEVQVEYEELVKGYSRQAHFTRAMQALRQQEATFQEHQQAVMQEREQYKVLLTQLHQFLTTQGSSRSEAEWAQLKATDPVGYTLAREEERERQEKIRAAELEFQQTQQRQQMDYQRSMQGTLAEEQRKLVEALPAWKDQKVAQKELENMSRYAMSVGFTEEDLAGITDHRALLVLRNAAKYAELVAKKSSLKPGSRSVKPATPGRSKQPRPRRDKDAQASRQKLKESGSVKDAAKAIAHLL